MGYPPGTHPEDLPLFTATDTIKASELIRNIQQSKDTLTKLV